MAVKIRLARRGRKKAAIYDIVVADARSPRDGKFIEKLGTYNPNSNPATIDFSDEKAFQWLMNGAQPTDTVKAMLSYRGILYKKHLQIGVNKGAITQETADARFEEWKNAKDAKIASKVESLGSAKEAARKAAFDAETKKKEARAEAIRQREADKAAANAPAAEAEEAPEAPETATEGEATTEEQA
ncbi:30S ribosomal protein S16 [Pontibacter sp. H259]|uniref:30S ribosomal protein S16 n=1 Tax=Pontibacter sp. H259 TaxID=3133421 RepID=UPI0030BAD98A